MPSDPLTLTREELYELVWSKPMTDLAKDFGLSDVAVAKRLRKLAIPVPGRGYWARVQAGQEPRRPKLPKRTEEPSDESSLTFGIPPDQPPPIPPPADQDLHPAAIAAMLITPTTDLGNLHPAVKRTALELKRPWRGSLTWVRSERQGPTIDIRVSEPSQDRALKLADSLLRFADQLGWKWVAPAPAKEVDRYRSYRPANPSAERILGQFDVAGEAIGLSIEERYRQVEHAPTEEQKRDLRLGRHIYMPRWDHEYRGELRVRLTSVEHRYQSKDFEDAKTRKVEDRIQQMLRSLWDLATTLMRQREEARLREIERQHEERLQRERAQRREAHIKLVHELERQAGAWHRARMLRAYLQSARRALGDATLYSTLLGEKVDFLDWAEKYVNQLDPLHPSARNRDLEKGHSYYTPMEEKMEAALLRLIGEEWEATPKLASQPSE
jgi:hypothetical protein